MGLQPKKIGRAVFLISGYFSGGLVIFTHKRVS